MKVLLHSYAFWPSVGGVETIAETLAENILMLGHECTVVTQTPAREEKSFPFPVARRPGFFKTLALIRAHDIVHANGSSMRLFWLARLAGKPFVWTHNGYQVCCVDGLGWSEGKPTPMTPLASLKYYLKIRGAIYAAKEGVKLGLRRLVARQADLNIAESNWVAGRQPLPNQVVAYTPFNLKRFSPDGAKPNPAYTFIFVGRLVSEKGVEDLLYAFAVVVKTPGFETSRLAIVGDGPERAALTRLAEHLGLANRAEFFGMRTGKELQTIVDDAKIAVVPSVWEEPMGGVSLELMAAGKNIIVSQNGGLAECAGDAGVLFQNGDRADLARAMVTLARDSGLQQAQLAKARAQLAKFDELQLTKKYIDIYRSVIER